MVFKKLFRNLYAIFLLNVVYLYVIIIDKNIKIFYNL